MQNYEEKTRVAKERLREAELAADALLRSPHYEHREFLRVMEELRLARDDVFTLFAKLWPER